MSFLSALNALAAATPRPAGMTFSYGTAGFRAPAAVLPSTFLRMGMLAALRSAQLGKIIGVMITASHNPVEDNGVKMVDPDGGMLAQTWEKHACTLANAGEDGVAEALTGIAAAEGISLDFAVRPNVFIAKDTRPSSESLAALVRCGAEAVTGSVTDYGVLTTPQLHHIVRQINAGGRAQEEWGSEEGYYVMLEQAYRDILQGVAPNPAARGPVVFDAAHGVGGPKLLALQARFADLLTVVVRNNVTDAGELNHMVGAEHVQKTRTPPLGVDSAADRLLRLASVDGDADRLVYHFFDAEGGWHLLDGDAIAALAASFFSEQLRILGIPVTSKASDHSDPSADEGLVSVVSVGVVQTAYANGASTDYIRNKLRMPVPLAKTGVKFVHHEAQKYDLGIYFEANGHGTVLFSPRLLRYLNSLPRDRMSEKAKAALVRVLAAAQLINQAVGDAISDALFIEAVLTLKGWTIQDWAATYTDLPSRQTKLAVADRTVIVTTEDETRVVSLPELQAAIDALVAGTPKGRAFVRPSGTEDVVRVYAEASTEAGADALALAVAQAAYTYAGGVGDCPSKL